MYLHYSTMFNSRGGGGFHKIGQIVFFKTLRDIFFDKDFKKGFKPRPRGMDTCACLLHACMNIQYGSRCCGAENIPGLYIGFPQMLYWRQKTVQYRNTAFCVRTLFLPGVLSYNQNVSGMDVVG